MQNCFICHTNKLLSNLIDIFCELGISLNIKSIVYQHFDIQLQDNENLKLICSDCWSIINSFHKLYENVQKRNHQYLIKTENLNFDVTKEEINLEKCIDIDDNSLINSKKQQKSRTKHIKLNDFDENVTDDYSTDEKSDENDNDYGSKIKTTQNCKNIIKENQQIQDFYKMTCNLCDFDFSNFLEARSHYTTIHQQAAYLICCSKKFYCRNRILDHMTQHLNPNAFKCPECNKTFADRFVLKNHIENHAPMDSRKYKCDICTSSFTKLFKLSQHLRITHCSDNEKKFQCSECQKFFLTKSKLTTHIRGVHELAYAQICHICAKTLKSKHSYYLHQREHAIVEVPKVQCKVCSAWLKNNNSLRNHMGRHNGESVSCNLCNKTAPNKDALGHHMREVHRERPYKCTLCEKTFTKARGLKEHIASHTGEDIYNCSYCPKTFKASASLHLHRKKIHPTEWQLDKVKNQKC